jgi:hypothetical protein
MFSGRYKGAGKMMGSEYYAFFFFFFYFGNRPVNGKSRVSIEKVFFL